MVVGQSKLEYVFGIVGYQFNLDGPMFVALSRTSKAMRACMKNVELTLKLRHRLLEHSLSFLPGTVHLDYGEACNMTMDLGTYDLHHCAWQDRLQSVVAQQARERLGSLTIENLHLGVWDVGMRVPPEWDKESGRDNIRAAFPEINQATNSSIRDGYLYFMDHLTMLNARSASGLPVLCFPKQYPRLRTLELGTENKRHYSNEFDVYHRYDGDPCVAVPLSVFCEVDHLQNTCIANMSLEKFIAQQTDLMLPKAFRFDAVFGCLAHLELSELILSVETLHLPRTIKTVILRCLHKVGSNLDTEDGMAVLSVEFTSDLDLLEISEAIVSMKRPPKTINAMIIRYCPFPRLCSSVVKTLKCEHLHPNRAVGAGPPKLPTVTKCLTLDTASCLWLDDGPRRWLADRSTWDPPCTGKWIPARIEEFCFSNIAKHKNNAELWDRGKRSAALLSAICSTLEGLPNLKRVAIDESWLPFIDIPSAVKDLMDHYTYTGAMIIS